MSFGRLGGIGRAFGGIYSTYRSTSSGLLGCFAEVEVTYLPTLFLTFSEECRRRNDVSFFLLLALVFSCFGRVAIVISFLV